MIGSRRDSASGIPPAVYRHERERMP